MATFSLEIDGQPVEVDAPDLQTAIGAASDAVRGRVGKFADAAKTQAAAPEGPPTSRIMDTASDVAKSLGAGVVRGVTGIATLPGNLENLATAGLDYIKPGFADAKQGFDKATNSQPYDMAQGLKDAEKVTGPLHEPTTTAGEYARTVGEFAPNALFPGGPAQRVLNTVVPAVASEAAGQATKGTPNEGVARFAAAALAPTGARTVLAAGAPFRPRSAEHARLAEVLADEGVDALTAGERTGNQTLKYAESALGGARLARNRDEGLRQYTQAALERAGENADNAAPAVLNNAFNRLGADFDRLAANTTATIDNRVGRNVAGILQRYDAGTSAQFHVPIVRDLATQILARPQLTGQEYQAFRSGLSDAIRNSGGNVPTRRALIDLMEEVDDAMARSMGPGMAQEWAQTRNQYRNLIAIRDSMDSAGQDVAVGNVMPQNLRAAVQANGFDNYSRGRGDLSELARAGEAVMKGVPQSGTAPRAAAAAVPAIIAGQITNALTGDATHAATAAGAAALAAPAIAGRTIMSRPVQEWLAGNTMAGRAALPIRMATSNSEATASGVLGGITNTAANEADGQPEDIPPAIASNRSFQVLTARGVPTFVAAEAVQNPAVMLEVLRKINGEPSGRAEIQQSR